MVSKNIKKALDLWNLVLEDWKHAQSLQIDNAKFLIRKFETKTITQVNADNNQKASQHLQSLYVNYLSVKGCHDLGSFYRGVKLLKLFPARFSYKLYKIFARNRYRFN